MTESIVEETDPIASGSAGDADPRTGALHFQEQAPGVPPAPEPGRQRPAGTDAQHRLRPARTDRCRRAGPGGDLCAAGVSAARTGATAEPAAGPAGSCRCPG